MGVQEGWGGEEEGACAGARAIRCLEGSRTHFCTEEPTLGAQG